MKTERVNNSKRSRFENWLRHNGAVIDFPRGEFQWVRFEAQGVLCIVYTNGHQEVGSFVPPLARECFDAWRSGRSMDLREEAAPDLESYHDRARRLGALHDRQSAGEVLDLDAEAQSFRMTGQRLGATLAAWERSAKARDAA